MFLRPPDWPALSRTRRANGQDEFSQPLETRVEIKRAVAEVPVVAGSHKKGPEVEEGDGNEPVPPLHFQAPGVDQEGG